ncbi:S8 family serine peptidase [Natrinema longum]|uniref:S8 family serine peptidase n=1 Tax=Natrinema longum TaxID=370324 RepID=A0A8A2UBU8_9EURY|nr:S8 family serine peptidase [Natrinema longum]MBZ6495957.1 S8 family serine peptidase [Natrinema longum]QSW86103.1 S8 family serine peptidase [Natrinema longum]
MVPRRPNPVSLPVFAVVTCLLLASVFAPVVLGFGLNDASATETESTDDDIVIDDGLPTNGTTVEAVVRLEEASVPEGVGEVAAERRLETHAASTQESLLEHVRETDGLSVEETFWLTNAVLVEVDTGTVDYETFEQFGAVEAVHENFEVSIPDSPRRVNTTASVGSSGSTVGELNTTAGVAQVNAPTVWEEYDTRGEGVRVAVLDTGVDISHPDIDLATDDPSDPTYPGGWAEFDASGQRISGSTPHDTGTHGTHVSGTVAGGATSGTAIGVAPEAELLHGLVMSETSGSFAQVVAGMEWALRSDADVINLSLGATGAYPALIDPVRNARHSGAVVVGAVGNEGAGTSGSPGNVYETISVGAVDGEGAVPPFSGGQRLTRTDWNGSPSDWDAPPSYVVPDVVAPGVAVTSAGPDGGYATIPGTSMAAPHVSGTAALLLSAESDATPDEIETALTETARVPENRHTERGVTTADGDGRLDTRYGHGIVDASAAADALVAVRGSTDPNTVRSSDVDTTDDPSSTSPPVFAAGIVLVGVTLTLALLARYRFGER